MVADAPLGAADLVRLRRNHEAALGFTLDEGRALLDLAERALAQARKPAGDDREGPPVLEGEVLRWHDSHKDVWYALDGGGRVFGYGYSIPGTLSGPPQWIETCQLRGLPEAIAACRARESLWLEYVHLLIANAEEPIRLSAARGWRCSDEDFAKGKELRRRLGLDDNNRPAAPAGRDADAQEVKRA